jgi:adenylate kinase
MRAGEYMKKGLLVPDEVTIDIVLDKVLELPVEVGFILDGFPRTLNQAEALEGALGDHSRGLDRVVFINVPDDELVRRLAGRHTCQDCQAPYPSDGGELPARCPQCGGELYQREDDRAEAIQKRLEVYQEETLPLLDFYRQRDILADVAGEGAVEEVNQRVLRVLDVGPISQ